MLTFNEAIHEYRYDGVKIPSVSEILERAGLSDFSMVSGRVLQIAQERGSFVHLACELFNRGVLDLDTVDPELIGYVDGWMAFCRDFKPKFKLIEQRLCNIELGYAGTPDCTALIKRKNTLIDIKTGGKTKAHEPQHGAYSMLDGIGHISEAWTVYLSKDGKYKIGIHDLFNGQRIFLAALEIHKYKNRGN